ETKSIGDLVSDGVPGFYAFHMAMIDSFYKNVLGVPKGRLRFLEKGGDEKAFYNKVHMDIEVNVESWGGFKEVGGLHYRGDYDLTSHSKGSSQDLAVNIDGKRVLPHVLELSFGVDRNVWMLLDVFLTGNSDRRTLGIKPYLAPYNVAVFALQHDDGLLRTANAIRAELKRHFKVWSDDSGSIGKRYARVDEIGVPFAITVDFDTIGNDTQNSGTVTVRSRDDRSQTRIPIKELTGYLYGAIRFDPYKAFEGFG
ncbi:MAG: His/Gly/Thr/Pro-type tRNA ligase C-terminal domain-containing protein, partial [Candidatus Marsarchaeota archaeon]|nr:His/Gly/Thr/Pro-type tRNA ligase C-terminal domain-containing protein [Candidatus Marsarchaeota archaeon]